MQNSPEFGKAVIPKKRYERVLLNIKFFLLLSSCIFLIYLFKFFFKSLRAPSHVKLYLQVKFLPELKKKWYHTWVSTQGETNTFYFISLWIGLIFAKICGIFYKNILRRKHVCMQLQDYTKILILDYINKSNKMFDFKTFKMFYWL